MKSIARRTALLATLARDGDELRNLEEVCPVVGRLGKWDGRRARLEQPEDHSRDEYGQNDHQDGRTQRPRSLWLKLQGDGHWRSMSTRCKRGLSTRLAPQRSASEAMEPKSSDLGKEPEDAVASVTNCFASSAGEPETLTARWVVFQGSCARAFTCGETMTCGSKRWSSEPPRSQGFTAIVQFY